MTYTWDGGDWHSLITAPQYYYHHRVPLSDIIAPWAWNIHLHSNYDRLFWSIWNDGMKTPLFVRPVVFPFKAKRKRIGCTERGARLDRMPSLSTVAPKYELVLGNMRYCAMTVQGHSTVPCIIVPLKEQSWDVEDLWAKYHPIFEGNWYNDPSNQIPSKAVDNFLI